MRIMLEKRGKLADKEEKKCDYKSQEIRNWKVEELQIENDDERSAPQKIMTINKKF